jgi:hypothetical protein
MVSRADIASWDCAALVGEHVAAGADQLTGGADAAD